MKTIKYGAIMAVSMAAVFGLSSCNSDPEPSPELYLVSMSSVSNEMNQDSYWSYCYDEAIGAVKTGGFAFSHEASSTVWEGVTHSSWKGFCPSRVNDTKDYSDGVWTDHQWAAIAANPNNGLFLVGNSGAEVSSNPLDNTTCSLEMQSGDYFKPAFAYVCNSSYAYYVAKNGNEFCPAFTAKDDLTLNIVGVRNDAMTAHLKMPLIKEGQYLTQWIGVSLENLGTVDKVLFYVDSSSKGMYGLNVPAYFCITDFAYTLPETAAN